MDVGAILRKKRQPADSYRIAVTEADRFAIVALMGLVNLVVIGRIILPGREA